MRTVVRIISVILVGTVLAGCDKCGNRVKFDTPSIPKACGDNARLSG